MNDQELALMLGRMDGKLDALLSAHAGLTQKVEKNTADIATLKQEHERAKGVALAIGGIFGGISGFLSKYLPFGGSA